MASAACQSLPDQLFGAAQVHIADRGGGMVPQVLLIGMLQCRAGDDGIAASSTDLVQALPQGRQPRSAVVLSGCGEGRRAGCRVSSSSLSSCGHSLSGSRNSLNRLRFPDQTPRAEKPASFVVDTCLMSLDDPDRQARWNGSPEPSGWAGRLGRAVLPSVTEWAIQTQQCYLTWHDGASP